MDQEFRVTSDRLVSQGPEFATGPKEKHDGPLAVEVMLADQKDIDDFLIYLQRLKGMMPMREVKKRGRSAGSTTKLKSTEARQAFVKAITEKAESSSLSGLLEELRSYGYIMLTGEYFKLLGLNEKIGISEKILDSHLVMVNRTRKAKDPKNDKYDPYFILAFKNDSEKIRFYEVGEKVKRMKVTLSKKKMKTVEDSEVLKFPHYMTEEERLKFSIEHRKVLDNPEHNKTKFYKRWVDHVEKGIRL